MPDIDRETMEEIYVQWAAGMPLPDLAEQYDIGRSKLSRELQVYRMGLNGDETDIVPRQGLRGGEIKLTFSDEQMTQMYEEFADGWSLADLSKKYDRAPSVISHNIKLWEMLLEPEDVLTDEERKEREIKVRARAKKAKQEEIKKRAQEALQALRDSRRKK
jgi:predicted DNA-binding protein YlxM (UPF0122 family)